MIVIKGALAILSGILCARSIDNGDGKLAVYWEIVSIYWLVNVLDQMIGG